MTLGKVDEKTTQEWANAGRAILIDVREPDEWITKHVQKAHLVPLSEFDPDDFPNEHD